ncbi:MAG: hypothetical protein Q9207_008349, partial [Kuettlingeria erythrocarpa]
RVQKQKQKQNNKSKNKTTKNSTAAPKKDEAKEPAKPAPPRNNNTNNNKNKKKDKNKTSPPEEADAPLEPDRATLQAAAAVALLAGGGGPAGPSSSAAAAAGGAGAVGEVPPGPGPKRPGARGKVKDKGPTKRKADSRRKGKEKKTTKAAAAGSKHLTTAATPPGLTNTAVQMQIRRRRPDALGPRPGAGVRKWGRYLLPPFGEPVWKLVRDIPTLIIPVLVDPADKDREHPDVLTDEVVDEDEDDDDDEEVRDQVIQAEVDRLRHESTQDPDNQEKRQAYRTYTANLTYAQFRSLGDGFMGAIDDFWNQEDEEEEERRRNEGERRTGSPRPDDSDGDEDEADDDDEGRDGTGKALEPSGVNPAAEGH